MRYLAVDIGASSGRHIVAEIKDGRLSLREVYRFPNGPRRTADGLVWDADALYSHIIEGLKAADAAGLRPDCVGIDTWAVDYVLLDRDGKRIGPAFCYRDERGAEAARRFHEVMPFETLYKKTGIQYQPFNTVYQLYADKLSGRLDGAAAMLMLPDWFNYRLTGVRLQEYTNATSTGMVGALTDDWDDEILSAAGVSRSILGKVTRPAVKVGSFSPETRREVGYDAVVMLPATHDTASAVVAAPVEKGGAYISSGTWSLLGAERARAITSEAAMRGNWSNEGGAFGGFRFQKNIMGLWMVQQVRHELGDAYTFAQLAETARAHPTDKRVRVNDEKFLSPDSMLDAIFSEAGNMALGETAYCIFASLADCYAESVRELEELTGSTSDTLNIIGGGGKNTLLTELTAKATGKRVLVGPTEGTAAGNVIMQMAGTGEADGIEGARALIKRSFDITEVRS